jgi:hypothetical protein
MASLSSSCLAAAQAAESGDWLELLEQHMAASSSSSSGVAAAAAGGDVCALPAVCPPGIRQGHFGAWRLPEAQRRTGGARVCRHICFIWNAASTLPEQSQETVRARACVCVWGGVRGEGGGQDSKAWTRGWGAGLSNEGPTCKVQDAMQQTVLDLASFEPT